MALAGAEVEGVGSSMTPPDWVTPGSAIAVISGRVGLAPTATAFPATPGATRLSDRSLPTGEAAADRQVRPRAPAAAAGAAPAPPEAAEGRAPRVAMAARV